MPVSGSYTWSESTDSIEVLIPLKGVSPKKVDVFTASTVLKVAYSPFLVDLNLNDEIDVEKCRAIVKDGTLKILLAKKDGQHKLWGQLCFEGTKDEVKQRRQIALQEHEQRVKHQNERVAVKKMEEERMVFQHHMALERREQQRMDDVKEKEKKNAEEAMYKTFSNLQSTAGSSSKPTPLLEVTDAPEESCEASVAGIPVDDLPPLRTVTHATFKHTPRLFKTPSRESTVKQEQEFIMKHRTNLKKNALLNGESINDIDPKWLQTKGDEFKSRGDYSSAVNAYSDAIEADDSMVDVIASRSACFLQMREGACCIKDCLAVLEMNKTIDTQFEKETRVRLGMAYCLNKEYNNGLQQFEEARELDQTDTTIEECISFTRKVMEATRLKEEADRLFANGEYINCINAYTEAIEAEPLLISMSALINRSACHLAMKNFVSCVEDSTQALQLLSHGRKRPTTNTLASLLFPDSQTKRKWIVTLLCRRSAARKLDKDLLAALDDLEEALQQAKQGGIGTEEIEKDIQCLKQSTNQLQN